MKFSVMGCGRWGSFIAWYLHKIGHEVCVWGRQGSANLAALQQGHMGDFDFPAEIRLTTDAAEAAAFADIIAISISSQHLREFMHGEAFSGGVKPVVLCMKGLEENTGKRLSEIASEVVGKENTAVWLGPGHVQNFLAGIPNCMVIDSYNEALKDCLIEALKGSLIRFYYGTDMIGNEIGAAAKNVIGIAAGILDGFENASLKGALMSRGAREISKLIENLGGNPMSAYGLAHLGDYEATVFSKYSRNRMYGEKFVRKEPMQGLAEGVSTSKALMLLAQQSQTELPICTAIYRMLYENLSPEEAMEQLFLRDLKNEF